MRRLTISIAMVLVLMVAGVVWAGSDVDVSGQLRLRIENNGTSFDTSATTLNFADMRTRIALSTTVAENAHVFVQFQDSRRAGEAGRSGTLGSGNKVDMHQAWVKLDKLFGEGWGAKAGKFEFILGNHRVFGNVGWSNVGRSWQGMMLWYENPEAKIMPFWLKRVERMDGGYNADFDIFGATLDIVKLNLNSFVAWEHDADSTDLARNKMDRLTIGAYYQRTSGPWDFELNAALQVGTMAAADTVIVPGPVDDTIKYSNPDISAMMFTFEAGHTFPGPKNARVAVGIDYTSGDKDATDDKYKAYNNLYFTGHKFNGYMDYFVGGMNAGLMDVMVKGSAELAPGWIAKLNFHFFKTAQDYVDPMDTSGTTVTSDVGMEIDVTVITTRVAGVKLVAGGSVFLPQDAFAGVKDADITFWNYFMATINF